MRKHLTIALLLGLWLIPSNIHAQGLNARQRAQELVASFNKSRHSIKVRDGVRVEKYKEIRSEPAIRNSAADYAGTYETDLGYAINIRVGADGRVQANGTEPSPRPSGALKFTLKNASIEEALLTGVKVYEDGRTEKFEGVFINRIERNSMSDSGISAFGLGVLYDPPKISSDDDFMPTRLFYQQK